MKRKYILFILFIISLSFLSCKESAEEKQQKSVELMSAQTLGLAYLEEFKLDDAEKEFLKFIEMAPDDKLGYANLGLVYLRMGKYADAEEQLFKAIKIDPEDPDIRLLLATVYQMNDERKKAISVLSETLKFAPDHVKILFDLAELYSVGTDPESLKLRKKFLQKLIKNAPANIVPRLDLTEIFITEGESDKALEQLEIIQKQSPEFPKEAVPYFEKTVSLLKTNESKKAVTPYMIFHNHMKVTASFQAGMQDLKGPGGAVVGFPLITYNRQSSSQAVKSGSLLKVIKFKEVTQKAGLNKIPSFPEGKYAALKNSTHAEIADYDGDGDMDIYIGNYDPDKEEYVHYLFRNDLGRYKDVSKEAGIRHHGKESSAVFADYDNDGFLDLYVVRKEGDILYRNIEKGIFKDVTSGTKIPDDAGGGKALFFDMDHDGDLDLFKIKNGPNRVFRNNGDGTFTEQTKEMGFSSKNTNSKDIAFGDFDDDGDIDILVVNNDTGIILYENQRQGKFKDITRESGLGTQKNPVSTSVADYNNDGFLDLFIGSSKGEQSKLYFNKGDGTFKSEKNVNKLFILLKDFIIHDSNFFDFDNDGFLDLLIAGEPQNKADKGLVLLHNEGNGNFKDVSDLLPVKIPSGKETRLFDYNQDGDLDILISRSEGGVFLLRNDGGNMNHYVNMKLVGLRTGSAKNNFFGIGAKVEIRAGDLYQTKVVTNPNVYFGLGNRSKVDVIRITWTNGVPQNILLPDTDQSITETQTLKGSCPFLYTWNGEKYVFVKDITWRSALGMPLGIMGGTTKYAFADASDDYIKIPGELLEPKNGMYSLQITSELWETIYMDQIQLVVADHPDSIDIYVPEQFSPPPFPGLDIHQVNKKYYPVSANNSQGMDLLPYILKRDDHYISDFSPEKYQGVTQMHDLIINPGDQIDPENVLIYLFGWIFPTDSSINYALSQSEVLKVMPPNIQVINKKGEWETVIPFLGFPMGKDKMVIADLSGKFLSDDHRIRIQTNMEVYWDEIFFSEKGTNVPINITVLNPESADIHYRGFSRTYRKGGRYGPHWFDYADVDKQVKWRDLTGNYTRYGDVKPLLMQADNQYIISNAGDETSVNFDTKGIPQLKNGWKRDFFIHSVGWVKDGDINTAYGKTVKPLPYHGISSYPPSGKDIYPEDPALQEYQKLYNTRVVNMDNYRNALKNSIK